MAIKQINFTCVLCSAEDFIIESDKCSGLFVSFLIFLNLSQKANKTYLPWPGKKIRGVDCEELIIL